jgi:hypothetical protein
VAAIRLPTASQVTNQKSFTPDIGTKSPRLSIYRLEDATLCPVIRKPFDVLVKGLLVPQSGEARTAIELFIAGIQGWEAGLLRILDDSADGK